MLPSGNVEDVEGVGGGVRSSRGEVAAEVELYLDDRRSAGIWVYLVSPLLPPYTRRRKDAIEVMYRRWTKRTICCRQPSRCDSDRTARLR